MLENTSPSHNNYELRKKATVGTLGPAGTLWPNGEFGLTWRFAPYSEPVDLSQEEAARLSAESGCPMPIVEPGGVGGPPPLDLTNHLNSHKKAERAPRGTHGLTSYARRMIRNACYVMQRDHGKDQLGFLTLTVPPMTRCQAEELNTNWAEVIRVFFQWFDRRATKSGTQPRRVGVTEVQSQRAKATGFLWLHYHCVFVGRSKKGSWWLTPKMVKKAWTRAIKSAVPSFTGIAGGENLQRVKKDAAAYICKYMSKGGTVEGAGELPSAWWNISTLSRQEVKREIQSGTTTSEWLQWLVDWAMSGDEEVFEWFYPVVLWQDDGDAFLTGFTGKVKTEWMSPRG